MPNIYFNLNNNVKQCPLFILYAHFFQQHPGICEFPSKQFYDGKLQTGSSPKWDIKTPLRIWINRKKIPIVFYHVEGEEEYLAVSTEEGNEQSRSNKKEVDKVVESAKSLVFLYIVHKAYCKVNSSKYFLFDTVVGIATY